MIAASDRLEFTPPTPPGFGRALGLALLAHLLLVAALTWGVHWKSQPQTISVDAELWSAVPKEAAPQRAGVAPEPQPEPEKVTPPPPPTPPAPKTEPEPPKVSEADIALEKEKLLLKKEAEKELLLEKQRLEKLKNEKLAREKELIEKKLQEKKLQEQKLQEKREQEKKLADEKRQKAVELERKAALEAKEDAKRMEAQRQANLKRMAGLAGATGAANATGKDLQSSGPSSGYAGRIRARIKPNIVFTEDINSNPVTEVDVRTSPDGTIISRKIIKSSGVTSWDEAVLRAIDKTETLPRDTNGQVPAALVISFRPKD
ncbi:cell envelope integrity protein TolA [Rhodoferax sp. PAMC 29310]|uniref:cell envelope integrity protein TolA n=1 Tax=Rhodoferax sp. PAMC 29310 TaxID=2822760 RepID=UPI001B332AE7|nr:cell envelope integrity protein TolA [Rhodoferax sp. PAMC 29310]